MLYIYVRTFDVIERKVSVWEVKSFFFFCVGSGNYSDPLVLREKTRDPFHVLLYQHINVSTVLLIVL